MSWTQSIEVEYDLLAAYPFNLNVEKGLAKFWKRRKSKTLRQKGHRNASEFLKTVKLLKGSRCNDSRCLASLTNLWRLILVLSLDFDWINIDFHFILLWLIFIILLYISLEAFAFVLEVYFCFCMFWFNFVLGLNFICLCFPAIVAWRA